MTLEEMWNRDLTSRLETQAERDRFALITAVHSILMLCDQADDNPCDGLRKVPTASIRQAIEEALG
jgi:hypothetical protein